MRKAFIFIKAFGFLLLLLPFSNANAQYCPSNATLTADSKIDSVVIGTTAFGSAGSICETYTDNSTAPAIPVLIGVPTPIRVVFGSCGGAFTRTAGVLVDWNNDLDFTDPGELVLTLGPTVATIIQQGFDATFTVPAGTLPGNKRMRIVGMETSLATSTQITTGCGTYSYGETEDYTINVIAPVGTDAGAVNVTSPAAPIAGGSQVSVAFNIGNYATNNITTATVGYQVDNNPPVTETWSGNISTGNLSVHTFGSLATVPLTGTFTLKVWVTNANGAGPDNNSNNDTITVTRCIALPGGTYTVGGATADFPTISASVAAMTCGGISGPVTFNIFPGVYNDTINLNGIPGASAQTPLTYTSITGLASDVVIRRPATAAPNSHVIRFANIPNVTLSNLTIVKTGATQFVNNYVVLFDNGCDFSSLINCVLLDSSTNNTNFNSRNVGFTAADGITISGNTIRGGYYGIDGIGRLRTVTNPTYNFGSTITNNVIDSTSNNGINITNQDFLTLSNNVINNPTFASNFGNGINLSGIMNSTINANSIRGNLGANGINIFNADGEVTSPNFITNNEISGLFRSTTPKGINISGSVSLTANPPNNRDAVEIANNSINLIYSATGTTTSTFQGAINITGGSATTPAFSNVGLYNNSVAVYGNMPAQYRALWVTGRFVLDSMNSNNNAFWLSNTSNPLIRVNNPAFDFPTLQAWRDSTGFDLNSVNTDPNYLNANLLIPNNGALNNVGVQLGYVTTDIQGTPRPSTPDIGAYEFTPSTFDAGVASIQKPNNGCGLTATDTVMVTIQNFGTGAISNFPVAYVVNNGTPVVETFTGTINGGQTASYTFTTTINLATPGTYNLIGYTSLSGDGLSLNDSSFKTVTSIPVLSTFPYIEGFENGNGGWLVGGANPSWQLGTPNVTQNGVTLSTAAGGVNSWLTNLTGPYNNSEVSYVQSPCFNLTTLTYPEVEFNVFWDTESIYDGGNLAYSIDGGTTWLTVGTVGSGIFNWYTVAQVNASLQQPVWANPSSGNTGSGTWVTAKHSLSNLAGQSQVLFRMRFYSDGSVNAFVGFGFDNFKLDNRQAPLIDSVSVLADTCFSGSRTVDAKVISLNPLTSVNLLYSLTGASNPNTVAPMTFNAAINRWVGTIPTGTPNTTITYRVSAIDSANLADTSGIRSFKNEPLVISAGADTTINFGDTATLNASLGFNQGSLQITEVMFNRGGTGTQATFPPFLPQTGFNDMFEITNLSFGPVPLAGLKLQVISNGTTINMDYALPNITLGGGERLMILPETGVNDSINKVYYAGLAFGDIINSGSASATILYDSTTTTAVSAVIQNAGTFPAAITVPASVYSGSGVTPTSSFSGFQRISTATNTSADWAVNTAAVPSTMGALNAGLTAASLSWAPVGGASIGNNPTIQVTPNSTTTYVLTITALGCTRTDSVTVFVGSQNITDAAIIGLISPNAGNNSVAFGTPIPVTIRCANVGNTLIPAGFDVGYTVNGVASTQTVLVPIPVGDTVNFTFTTPWTPTVGGTNTLCVYMVSGTIVGDANVSNDTSCVTILGVNTEKLENEIGIVSKVFPNPATDKVYFEIGADVKDGILMVYNNLGQAVANINVNDLSKGNMITLETSNYASGIYTFSLSNGDKVQTGRFVITR